MKGRGEEAAGRREAGEEGRAWLRARLARRRLDVPPGRLVHLEGPLHAREVDAPEDPVARPLVGACGAERLFSPVGVDKRHTLARRSVGACVVRHQAVEGKSHLDRPAACARRTPGRCVGGVGEGGARQGGGLAGAGGW